MNKKNTTEMLMICFIIGILLILFLPIPTYLLDLLLLINFSWALTILLITFFTDKPLSFSTFPTLLLIATLFRLALNISATRLILSQGNAGQVISTMGQYVIHGNYVMGFVVFFILIIVQFIVVTNGSQRIAEVAARFTLDSMPGKQMSIDADLNMGLITQEEAKARRTQVEKEANFYGTMDGASKFVKGDAIAGILIMLVDVIGGFVIGIFQQGLSLTAALQKYALLTVGDGLITQFPALIISVATGIIVTRAASDAHLGKEVSNQFLSHPESLMLVCISLVILLFLDGMPLIPLLLLLILFSCFAWYAYTRKSNAHSMHEATTEQEETLYEKIKIHPIEIYFHPDLFSELQSYEQVFFEKIKTIRERIAYDLGFTIPEVKIRPDKTLKASFYHLIIQGCSRGSHPLYLSKYLAIGTKKRTLSHRSQCEGIEVKDPSYGLPARWISPTDKTRAEQSGYAVCEPLSVLSTHLYEVIQSQLGDLLTRNELESLLNQSELIDLREEIIPSILSLAQLHKLLQQLLNEKVSIRHLASILEVISEYGKQFNEPLQLTEVIRTKLGPLICQKLTDNEGKLAVLSLSPSLEQKLINQLTKEGFALEPILTETFITSLSQHIEKMIKERKKPVLLCAPVIRKHMKQLTQRLLPQLTVLSFNEIPLNILVEPFGSI